MRRATLLGLAGLTALSIVLFAAALPDSAVTLRNRGFAELENEQPAKAELSFRELAKLSPADPLPHANLAIALLRQQKTDEALDAIGKGLAAHPNDHRLIAIRGEIESWSGKSDAALDSFRQAARLAPNDLEAQYMLYRTATTTGGEGADEAAAEALRSLARLRPENLVVLLQLGRSARERGDRAQASATYLRIRDLIWQAPPAANGILNDVLDKLEAGELPEIRVPSLRLENVLKVTPMFRESLRELQTGIQGIPLEVFRNEPPAQDFGNPAKVSFKGRQLDKNAGLFAIAADLTGDETPELIRLDAGGRLELLGLDAAELKPTLDATGATKLLVADLDNDGAQDVFAFGPEKSTFWRNGGEGVLEDKSAAFGVDAAKARAATVIDFDIEGDLDLVTFGDQGSELYRNRLSDQKVASSLEAVGSRSLPAVPSSEACDVTASDLDGDGDLDLLLLQKAGLVWLDNLRQGRFRVRETGIDASGLSRIATGDLNGDGLPDLVGVGQGIRFYKNLGNGFANWDLGDKLRTSAKFSAVILFDADNDGRLDVGVGGEGGVAVLARTDNGFSFVTITNGPGAVTSLAASDLDQDGDLDLLADGESGLHILDNKGGNSNRWLAVRLKGLDKGNSKNNIYGVGATLEVRAGSAYQFREVTGEVTHFGLGQVKAPDLVRVVWTNGVPQNRFDPQTNQRIVEEQVLKGSCPFLYAWNGEEFTFTTDLLWGAPIGLPVAEGIWAGADPEELVRIDNLRIRDGRYDLQITEELWEAAFFDYTRLWVVDHPVDVEVASSLKIVPGRSIEDRVLASRRVRPVARAWDASGRDVLARVLDRDEIYADGWQRSRYQGLAAEPWTFTFDLGEAPARPIRLHLEGWIFPSDASLNLAMDQNRLAPSAPALEMKTTTGWEVLVRDMGFPAGKTKTMIVDTPTLPANVTTLRIASNQWLSWDRIAWTTELADDAPQVIARLEPAKADLHLRGFSSVVREAPNAPHTFDYAAKTTESPWLPFPGNYTRYGDVRELLLTSDSLSVVLGPGDEMSLSFDATDLPGLKEGWKRTLFLESHGWDKDADRNTYEAARVEPLPFRGMSGYPYPAAESFPDGPPYREYLDEYQTREIGPLPRPRPDLNPSGTP